MRLTIFCLIASALLVPATRAQVNPGVPVFEVTPVESKVSGGGVGAIQGKFDKWTATLTFASTDVSTGMLDIEIQADSVDTGSGMKNGKLKGKDFFDVRIIR